MTKQDAIKILTDGEWWDYLGDPCPDIYNLSDAIDYAIDAMHERDTLKAENEQPKRERDAAIADMRLIKQRDDSCLMCKYVDEEYPHCGEIGCWQWRGIKEGAEDG